MEPWIPWDADEEEIADLFILREAIPPSLRSPLLSWISNRLPSMGYSGEWTTPGMVHTLEGVLRISFNASQEGMPRARLIDELVSRGEKMILRAVDFLASLSEPDNFGHQPKEIQELDFYLGLNRSAVEIYLSEKRNYRLRSRLPEGVEELAQAAINMREDAGVHLANAWHAAFDLEPNESYAMTEAIRAVEAACKSVVLPKDKKATLNKCVIAMRDQKGWTLVLNDSDGYPDHLQVLIGMIETLAKAQPDRHAGTKPTVLQAQAHVQLASTLVHWFASGAVVRVATSH
ncbi:hypothetical protein WJX64_02830 [Leifsonia sp. YIM 134122]|uniref:Uncharacterized protein n=1 Tax=Leifsonia stereocauli TaxID=3134136 RepID=A0ABU9W0F4_9MICO